MADDRRWEAPLVYQVPGMEQAQVRRGLVYRRDGDAALEMDIYAPPALAAGARLPAVFFIHGGPLPAPMRPLPREWGVYMGHGRLAAASGFVGVTFNHRYHAIADLPQADADITAAIAYVRDQAAEFAVDPDRIALWAFSGGGFLLSRALREQPPAVRALVAYYARLDLRQAPPEQLAALPPGLVDSFSLPVALAAGGEPRLPLLLARAGIDQNAGLDAFVAAALERNAPLDLLNHARGRHAFDVLDDDPRTREILARTILFLQARLGA